MPAEENTSPGGDLNTLICRPSFSSSFASRYRTAIAVAEDGSRQAILLVDEEQDDPVLEFRKQSHAQKASFDLYWRINKGSYYGIKWTNPISSVLGYYYFDPDTDYVPRLVQPVNWQWTVKLLHRKI